MNDSVPGCEQVSVTNECCMGCGASSSSRRGKNRRVRPGRRSADVMANRWPGQADRRCNPCSGWSGSTCILALSDGVKVEAGHDCNSRSQAANTCISGMFGPLQNMHVCQRSKTAAYRQPCGFCCTATNWALGYAPPPPPPSCCCQPHQTEPQERQNTPVDLGFIIGLQIHCLFRSSAGVIRSLQFL